MPHLFRQGRPGKKLSYFHYEQAIVTPTFSYPFFLGKITEKEIVQAFPNSIESSVHIHQGIEIVAVLNGTGQLYLDGVYYDLEPNDCYFTNAMVPHGTFPGPGYVQVYGHLGQELLMSVQPPENRLDFMRLFYLPLLKATPVLINQKEIAVIMADACNEYYDGKEYKFTKVWLRTLEAITKIASCVKDLPLSEKSVDIQNQQKILKAIEYIHVHFADIIDLEKMAEHASLSRTHFFRLFNKVMYCTPHEYCNRIRVNHALEQISTTDKKIEAIAFDSGFESLSSFSRVFKNITGNSPATYRNGTK